MLRINFVRNESEQRWTLCGQLAGAWVAELRTCWEKCGDDDARSIVDLSDVTFIDETGEKLLLEMLNRGTEFVASGVDTRHLLKTLKARGERPLRRFIKPLAR
jgi:ABC-type transporter Mla MlaB component